MTILYQLLRSVLIVAGIVCLTVTIMQVLDPMMQHITPLDLLQLALILGVAGTLLDRLVLNRERLPRPNVTR